MSGVSLSISMVAGALAAIGLNGCASAAPVGGREFAVDHSLRTFGRSAAARPTPSEQLQQPTLGPTVVAAGARDTAVRLALGLVGKKRIVLGGKKYGDDCTGLVLGVYAQLGMDLLGSAGSGDNGVTAIWRYALSHGRVFHGGQPIAGDLVFFRETYDLNRDGHVNDGLTHIGLVEKVGEDGTVTVIHRVARGVVRYKMNLQFRDSALDSDGNLVNDYLRMARAQQKPRLTAQLFAGYATLLPIEPRFANR